MARSALPTSVLCCYTEMRQETLDSLLTYAPDFDMVNVSGDDYGYWKAINSHWNGTNDLVIIEHDIEIDVRVMPSFKICDRDWCLFSYNAWSNSDADADYEHALGCTKFSAHMQRLVPAELFYGRYGQLDTFIVQVFGEIGITEPHIHGKVKHHHRYPGT